MVCQAISKSSCGLPDLTTLGIDDDRLSFAEHISRTSGGGPDLLAAIIFYDSLNFTGVIRLLGHDGLDRYSV